MNQIYDPYEMHDTNHTRRVAWEESHGMIRIFWDDPNRNLSDDLNPFSNRSDRTVLLNYLFSLFSLFESNSWYFFNSKHSCDSSARNFFWEVTAFCRFRGSVLDFAFSSLKSKFQILKKLLIKSFYYNRSVVYDSKKKTIFPEGIRIHKTHESCDTILLTDNCAEGACHCKGCALYHRARCNVLHRASMP